MSVFDQLRQFVRNWRNVEFTEEEMALLADHTEVYALRESPTFYAACGLVSDSVAKLINCYGDTGHGDKPPGLDRVTYWFQHLPDKIATEIAALQTPPSPLSVEVATRPPSTAKKCHGCKRKFERGRLHVVVAQKASPFYGTDFGGGYHTRKAGYCFDTACIAAKPWTLGHNVSTLLSDEPDSNSLTAEEAIVAAKGVALLADGAPSVEARDYKRVL